VIRRKGLWKQLAFSFVVNWIIAPLVMVFLIHLKLIEARPGLGILA
jgi:ACR3 family arsenite efflux pump ArsB